MTLAGNERSGRIRVGTAADAVFIHVDGRGTHLNSQPLGECLGEMIHRGYRTIRLDLQTCSYMDSTFLGVIASACLRLKGLPNGRFILANVGPRNLELLRTLGIERFFEFEGQGDGAVSMPMSLEALPESACSLEEMGSTMLEAHRTLAECDARNLPRFKDVIDFLEHDLSVRRASNK
jgi:anti-anti-sigma factor